MNDNINFRKGPVIIREGCSSEPYHMHRNAQELIWLLEGEAGITFNNKEYILNSHDDLMLLVDADFHKIRQISDHLRYISFYIDLPYFEKYIKDILHVGLYCNPGYRSPEQQPYLQEMRWILAQLLWEYRSSETSRRIEDLTAKLLLLLRNHFNFLGTTSIDYKEPQTFDRMFKVYDFIYQHYTERVTLTDLAQQINVSPAYLSRSIKRITGMSFKDMLNYVRCEEAVRLLLETNKSITAIAYDCGFSDTKFFNKYFADFFHGNPTEFRKVHKLEQKPDLWEFRQSKVKFDTALEDRLREYWKNMDAPGAGIHHFIFDATEKEHGRGPTWDTLVVRVSAQELSRCSDVLSLLQTIQHDIAPLRLVIDSDGNDTCNSDEPWPSVIPRVLRTGCVNLFCRKNSTDGLFAADGIRTALYYVLCDIVPAKGFWHVQEDSVVCRSEDGRTLLLLCWNNSEAANAEIQISFHDFQRRFLVAQRIFSAKSRQILSQLTSTNISSPQLERILRFACAPSCSTEIANGSEFGLNFKISPGCLNILTLQEI